MRHYVLTERGKIMVASLIAFFLILPSLILVIWVLPKVSSPNDLPDGQNTGDDSNPDSVHILPGDNDGTTPGDQPSTVLRTFDFENGILSFIYIPESQIVIDENITSMIGELISSPQNIEGSKFSVEIPQLLDGDTAILTTAIINAFNTYGIKIGDIVFYVYLPRESAQTFEIKMMIQQPD